MTNEVVSSFDRYPITSLEERIKVLRGLRTVAHVAVQDSLDGADLLTQLRPDYVVHGDNWREGPWPPCGRAPWRCWRAGAGSWWSSPSPTATP